MSKDTPLAVRTRACSCRARDFLLVTVRPLIQGEYRLRVVSKGVSPRLGTEDLKENFVSSNPPSFPPSDVPPSISPVETQDKDKLASYVSG